MSIYLTGQELGQGNISLVKKNQLKESFEKVASELQAITKAKTAADQKLVCPGARSLLV